MVGTGIVGTCEVENYVVYASFFFCTPCSVVFFFLYCMSHLISFENKNGLVYYYYYHKGSSPLVHLSSPYFCNVSMGKRAVKLCQEAVKAKQQASQHVPPENTLEKQPAGDADLPTETTRTGRPICKATKGIEDLVKKVKLSKNRDSEEENIPSTDPDYIQTSSTAWDNSPDKYSEDDSAAYKYIEESQDPNLIWEKRADTDTEEMVTKIIAESGVDAPIAGPGRVGRADDSGKVLRTVSTFVFFCGMRVPRYG